MRQSTKFNSAAASVLNVTQANKASATLQDKLTPRNPERRSDENRYIPEKDKELFVYKLRLIIQEAQGAIGSQAADLGPVTERGDDWARAQQIQKFASIIAERNSKKVLAARTALRKIQDPEGEFGICEETGKPISYRRLLAEPTTTLSIEAKEEQEKLERESREDAPHRLLALRT